jgi:hypothetical protein
MMQVEGVRQEYGVGRSMFGVYVFCGDLNNE